MTQEFTTWPRRVTGKLVQSRGGPIKGDDYRTTARSVHPPFPDLGSAVGLQSLGIHDRENWWQYSRVFPGGAIYSRPFAAPDGVYAVVSRFRPYQEQPDVPNSRYYVESIHAAHLVSSLDFSSMFQLVDGLQTEPLMELDSDFPPLVLQSNQNSPLPGDWFPQCRPMISAIASGLPMVVGHSGLSADQFFIRALWAVSCLPAALRWRVPIAAGMYSIPRGNASRVECILALAYECQSTCPPSAGSAGESFVRWFADATDEGRQCKRIQDVFDVIASKFPLLARWNDILPSESFESAVRVLDEVRRVEALRLWARRPFSKAPSEHAAGLQGDETPVVRDIIHLQSDVLKFVSDGLKEPIDQYNIVVSQVVGQEWAHTWSRFVEEYSEMPPRMKAIGHVLGILSPLDPEIIASELPRIEVSRDLIPEVSRRLSRSFRQVRSSGEVSSWIVLLANAFTNPRPAWFCDWVRQDQYPILWTAMKLFLFDKIDVTGTWNVPSACRSAVAVRDLLREGRTKVSDLDGLFEHVSDEDRSTALKLAQNTEEAIPEVAVRLALRVPLRDWLDRRTDPKAIPPASAGLIRALAAVGKSEAKPDRLLAESLLKVWDRLQAGEQHNLREPLRNVLRSLDSLLFTKELSAETSPIEDWVWKCLRDRSKLDVGFQRDVILAAARNPECVGEDFRRKLLDPLLIGSDVSSIARECRSLNCVLQLRSGQSDHCEELSEAELQSVELWTVLFRELPHPLRQRSMELTRAGQFPIAALYCCDVPSCTLDASRSFWKEWISAMWSDSKRRECYLHYVRRAGLESQDIWRFALGWKAIGRLSARETTVMIETGLMAEFLRTVILDDEISTDTIASVLEAQGISKEVLSNACDSLDECDTLYRRFHELLDEASTIAFWEKALEMIPPKGFDTIHSMIDPGWRPTVVRVVKGVLRQRPTGWIRLAIDIYKSTERRIQVEMTRILNLRRNSGETHQAASAHRGGG